MIIKKEENENSVYIIYEEVEMEDIEGNKVMVLQQKEKIDKNILEAQIAFHESELQRLNVIKNQL